MDTLSDFRYALRSMLKTPGLALAAVVALGLGIGLTSVMFSIVYGALFRGLPFPDGDRIMAVARSNAERDIEETGVPIQDYLDWKDAQTSFETLAADFTGTVNVRSGERPDRYDGAFITANGLSSLGVRPVLGRLFREDEDVLGAPAVMLLGWDVWQNHFGGDPGVVGRQVTVNGEPGTIIGVMPKGFAFPESQEVWLPLREEGRDLPRGQGTWVSVFGRLKPGVTVERARAEMAAIMARLEPQQPPDQEGFAPVVHPFTESFIGKEPRQLLITMMGAVMLVLLVACANVANLLLARASTRTRDGAIRTALGASRWRVVRQLLSEAGVLAAAGAVLGLGITWVGIGAFARAVAPTDPPFFLLFKVDAPIVAFVMAVAAVAALAAGVMPALRASSTDVSSVLKDESRGTSSLRMGRLSRILVVGEITLSMGLLVVAALMGRGMWTMAHQTLPYPTKDVFTARVGLFEAAFPDTASRRQFWTDLRHRLEGAPGVAAVSLVDRMPGTGTGTGPVAVDGVAYPDERSLPRARGALADVGFFKTFEAEPLEGRVFTEEDGPNSEPVAVVNESMARKLFPGGSAVGRRFRAGGLDAAWRTVVGVVPDLDMQGLGNNDPDPKPEGFYVPLAQGDNRFMSIVLRTTGGEPMAMAGPVRDAVASVDPDTPIYFVRTLQESIDQGLWFYRVFGTLFATFGLAALFLASVGLYGVMAFSVSNRTQEIGVRMALGAETAAVLRLIFRQGMTQVVLGLVLGLGLAVLLGRALKMILYQVSPADPLTFAAVSVVLALTGVVALLAPALRATRVDPVKALAGE